MTSLKWDNVGERFFEAGVDRGVLYPRSGKGVAWTGLVSVNENPSGGETTPYYYDGVKYLQTSETTEFGGTISAYTYPEEFAQCEGSFSYGGLSVHDQERSEFNLSYRTKIGNDLQGIEHGYKIHLVYNALATPSASQYSSMDTNAEAMAFSWAFTTRVDTDLPVAPDPLTSPGSVGAIYKSFTKLGLSIFSHVTIDSRKTDPSIMAAVENTLYGTGKTNPRMPSLIELFSVFDQKYPSLIIEEKPTTGLSLLLDAPIGIGDLTGSKDIGLYEISGNSTLTPTTTPGLYTVE